jgi:hypothetical protein
MLGGVGRASGNGGPYPIYTAIDLTLQLVTTLAKVRATVCSCFEYPSASVWGVNRTTAPFL